MGEPRVNFRKILKSHKSGMKYICERKKEEIYQELLQ